MQIYKELNIGTAKPTAAQMGGIRHHMIDVSPISEPFCVAAYAKMAGECAQDIASRGKNVIVCGGTGLYIDHFLGSTKFTQCENDPAYRNELNELPSGRLHAMLEAVDEKSASLIHRNNKKRIVRALEIFKITGKTKSEQDESSKAGEPAYDFVKIGLDYLGRELLYENIDRRTDQMIEAGLVEEARKLYESGAEASVRRVGAIGYAELFDFFAGTRGFGEAIEKIKQHTRNYAKRQLTWFRKDPRAIWLEPDGGCVKKILGIIS